MAKTTSTGTRLYVVAGDPATFDEAGYAALSASGCPSERISRK
jgi:hypothetical protein